MLLPRPGSCVLVGVRGAVRSPGSWWGVGVGRCVPCVGFRRGLQWGSGVFANLGLVIVGVSAMFLSRGFRSRCQFLLPVLARSCPSLSNRGIVPLSSAFVAAIASHRTNCHRT